MAHESTPDPSTPSGVETLRGIAENLARIRHALEHGDIPAARHAAGHLVLHLERLPSDRAAYEALCDEADRALAADPTAWDQSAGRKSST